MIANFEQRLAEVLGVRLEPPFRGRVSPAPGPSAASQRAIVLSVGQIEPRAPDVGSTRREIAPGSPELRRVVRLRCEVGFIVRGGTGQGTRDLQLRGLGDLLHALDAPDLRDGTALRVEGDLGFLIESMRLVRGAATDVTSPAVRIGTTVEADGWFWPPSTPGEAGVAMRPLLVRSVALPIALEPAVSVFRAGGGVVEFTVRAGTAGTLGIDDPPPEPPTSPFGALALSLAGPGGQPGAGSLAGGSAGPGGSRIVDLTGGVATFTYTPPASPTRDELVVSSVAVVGDEQRVGVQLARFAFRVDGA